MGPLRPVPAAREPQASRGKTVFLWVFSLTMVITAGCAFLMKVVDFWITATREGSSAMASFLIPVLNYLCVAAGFGLLFLWAYSRGQFRDVEGQKHRMLELNERFDRLWEQER